MKLVFFALVGLVLVGGWGFQMLTNLGYVSLAKALVPTPDVERLQFDERLSASNAGRLDTAERWFRIGLRLPADHSATEMGLAQVMLGDGRAEKAETLLRHDRSDIMERGGLKQYHLGRAALVLGDVQGAISQFGAVGAFGQLTHMCDDLRTSKRFSEATDCYTEASRIKPENPWPLLALGMINLDEKDYDQAEYWLRRVLAVAPGDGEARGLLGRALYMRTRNADVALAQLETALTLAPQTLSVYTAAVDICLANGRPLEAHQWAERAIEADPASDESWMLLARVEQASGRTTNALDAFQKAASLNRTNIWSLLGQVGVLMETKSVARATEVAQQAVTQFPESGWGYYYLGLTQLQAESYEAARLNLLQAVSIDASQGIFHYGLARYYCARQQVALCLDEAELAADLAPDQVGIQLFLGQQYTRFDRKDEARRAYLHVLELEPGNSAAQSALGGLASP